MKSREETDRGGTTSRSVSVGGIEMHKIRFTRNCDYTELNNTIKF